MFHAKIAIKRHFFEVTGIFFRFFFAETVVLLIFALTKSNLFYSHNYFLKISHYEQD